MTIGISQPWNLAAPTREGVFCDIPAESYHTALGVSQSMLKHMRPTPAHLLGYLECRRKQTPAMKMGTLVHSRVLEPETPLPLAVKPEGMRFSTKEGKAWRAEQRLQGLTIITQEEGAILEGCVASVTAHPRCREIFASGEAELSIFKTWHCEGGATLRKARLDWLPTNSNAIVDIKTCQDASEAAFRREILERGYHRQAAYYLDIYNDAQAEGTIDVRTCFVFVAVEKAPPYCVRVYDLSPKAIALGRRMNVEDLQTYTACRASGVFPGYPEDIAEIDLPNHAYPKPII